VGIRILVLIALSAGFIQFRTLYAILCTSTVPSFVHSDHHSIHVHPPVQDVQGVRRKIVHRRPVPLCDDGMGDRRSQLGWGFMQALNSTISNVLPPLVNIADLARYAQNPMQTWTITYGLFISKPIVILMGMVIASCGKHLYGTTYWNLWDFFNAVLDDNWNAGARTLVFLACLTQVSRIVLDFFRGESSFD
jgi:hypothetical protein